MTNYEITLALSSRKSSYYDRATNTKFTIQNRKRTIEYSTYEEIQSILDNLLSKRPTLIYYGGEIPGEFIDEYLKTYPQIPEGATVRAREHGTTKMRILSANNMDERAKELKEKIAESMKEKEVQTKAAAPKTTRASKTTTKAAPKATKKPEPKEEATKEEPKEKEDVQESLL